MNTVLAIDTAAPRLQLALLRADGSVDSSVDELAQGHAELLFPRLDALLERNGVTFVGTIIASSAPSAIAYLYYADRLYQLPLGIIGIAIGTVLLPELARHLKGGRDREADAAQNQSLLISMLLSMPAAVALIAIAFPIVRVLFQHGAFDATATVETSNTLIWFSAGLPAYVLIRVLQPGFFAREDTLTPTWFAGVSAATNIVISLILFPYLQHVGIAIATSVAAWANAVLLAVWLARRGHFRLPAEDWRRHGLIIICSLVMGLVLYALSIPLAPFFASGAHLILQLIALAFLCAVGLVLYFVLVHVTGAQPLGLLLKRLKRG